jgi:geranylgeranyl diphosphate synthase, type I
MTAALPVTLHRSRDIVEPALRAAVDRLDDASRSVAAYHLGWVDLAGNPAVSGGKAVRPALALLSAQAAGASPGTGLPGAVAVELVHNFSLLHDDLMDQDRQRRHRPTVWSVWGPSTAILVGDAMLALAYEVLADDGAGAAAAAASLLADASRRLIAGQVADLSFERRETVTVRECLAMAAGKTGALLGAAAAIGAVLAEAPAAMVASLQAYGEQLGLAFQLVDDLLGIWGDAELTGKPVGSDLRARKKSLPVAYALEAGGGAGRELMRWLAKGREDGDREDSDDEIGRAADLVEAAGGRAWARLEADRRLRAAAAVLEAADLAPRARDELVALGRFVVSREA